jgi:hypothetical protein
MSEAHLKDGGRAFLLHVNNGIENYTVSQSIIFIVTAVKASSPANSFRLYPEMGAV